MLQTLIVSLNYGFTQLWFYTTLKQRSVDYTEPRSFTQLWFYTTLKRWILLSVPFMRFTQLWFYTTLKLPECMVIPDLVSLNYDFTLLSNHSRNALRSVRVSLNYDFTLLSNKYYKDWNGEMFHSTMILHYSQTTVRHIQECFQFHSTMILHYSQTLIFLIFRRK